MELKLSSSHKMVIVCLQAIEYGRPEKFVDKAEDIVLRRLKNKNEQEYDIKLDVSLCGKKIVEIGAAECCFISVVLNLSDAQEVEKKLRWGGLKHIET